LVAKSFPEAGDSVIFYADLNISLRVIPINEL